MAILSASSARSAVIRGDMDHPTIMRDHMSMTTARYSQPWWVLT